MKDNKKKKDRRKYPQGSAASHAGQNSGNHGGHAGHPRSRSSKLLKNRKTLLMDLVSSKNYEPMRLKDIAMLLQVPKAKRSELAEVMEILVKEGKIDVISDGRYQKSRGASTTTEKREKRDRRAGEQGRRGRDDRFRRKNGKDGDTEKKPRIQTVDIQAVVDAYQIPEEFPARVITQAEKCPEEVIPNDYNGRLDLKSWQMVTIDGEDAKDLDDAVSVTKAGDTWTLGVHIADVSNYVQENSALDREALKRGTSVYLPDRVIPMLPKRLSNGICSLNEGQERLALSCIMTINEKGRVIGHQIAETVIRVDRRMTYTAVNAILTEPEAHPELLEEYHELVPMFRQMQELSALIRSCRKERGAIDFEFPESKVILDAEGTPVEIRPYPSNVATRMIEDFMLMANETVAEEYCTREIPFLYTAVNAILTEPEAHPELLEEYHELVPMFRQMQELSALIRSCRKERGAIDFEFPESKVILDAEGTPVEIRPYPSNVATRMIEDFMLMANETVAEEYCTREIPFLYRTHDKPDGDRMEATLMLIREQGIKVEKRSHEITPGEVQKILTSIEGTPEEPLISRLLLRSMARAIYTPECSGHFGLAASYYCHFTSPIRRYPDLQIHRIIKDDLRGRLDKGGRIGKYSSILQHVAEQSSAMEQRAAEAEREAVKLKKAEYMLEHVGEEYDGVISGVTGWGFYVELQNTVEGLVHIMTLKDDYYNFDEENYRLVGEQHGRVFRLGEPVRVRVRNAEPANRTIDFTYVEKETETE